MTTKEDLGDVILNLIDSVIAIITDILTLICELVKDNRDLIELSIMLLPVFPIFYMLWFHLFKAID